MLTFRAACCCAMVPMSSCACVVAKYFVQFRKLELDLGPLSGELQGSGGSIPAPLA